MTLLVAVFLTILSAVACAPVRIVESNVVTFVKLDRPIKFGREIYTPEQSFRLIELNDGQQAVILGSQIGSLLPTNSDIGVTIDSQMCFSGKQIVREPFGIYAQYQMKPRGPFCFQIDRKVKLK